MVGVHHGQLRGNRSRVRERREWFSALGLPSILSLLGRPGPRKARRKCASGFAAPAGLCGLRELVLRPPRGAPALAPRRFAAERGDVRHASTEQAPLPEVKPIPSEPLIRLLLANEMYDDGLAELRHAQRAWGNSARIDATIAWVYNRKGELRRAISLMRRTYPQFLTAGGQELPAEILQVIFPLVYWDSIRKYSAQHDLDPYLVAALVAQESTFDAGVRSSANAWGLMQLVPSTGRKLARSLGLRFTMALLTNPEINLRMGTLYFSDLVSHFGGTYYALASYNAGDSRVTRWKSERPGLDEDEFIDDIPFPETQNYVKRILGTAEDYRRLYPDGSSIPRTISTLTPTKAPAKASAARKSTTKKKAPPKKTTPTRKKTPVKKTP